MFWLCRGAAAVERAVVVEPPPADFDLKEIRDASRAHVAANYPDLLDLVEDGANK